MTLEGGFRYGEITSIAGAHGTGKTTIAFHAMASYLLSTPKGEVAIIDTSGTFSPVRLRDVIALRLRTQQQRTKYQQSGYVYAKVATDPEPVGEGFVSEATSMLNRVKVMRIFDVAGLTEAVGEIAEICEQAPSVPVENGPSRRAVVVDSEDDLSEDDSCAEGFDTGGEAEPLVSQHDNMMPSWDGKIGMIIVDTIASILGPLMGKSQIQGQALLTNFMRTLRHLTNRRQICTILSNSVIGVNTSKSSQYQRRPDDDVSIFSSVMGRPALGKSFTYMIDTSIMLYALPKRKEDADILYGDTFEGRQAQYTGVFEVLYDKNGTRAESWAAFEIVDGVEIKSAMMDGT